MSTSPAEDPVSGVVTFTARGDAALDELAAALVAGCDGSPASVADILEQILQADIEDLAETLTETAQSSADLPGRDVDDLGPAGEIPHEAARRRLGACMPGAAGTPQTRSFDVRR